MKITISGSMTFAKKMKEVKNILEHIGHTVFMPIDTENHVNNRNLKSLDSEISHDEFKNLTKDHFDKIKKSDGILILNYDKNGI